MVADGVRAHERNDRLLSSYEQKPSVLKFQYNKINNMEGSFDVSYAKKMDLMWRLACNLSKENLYISYKDGIFSFMKMNYHIRLDWIMEFRL